MANRGGETSLNVTLKPAQPSDSATILGWRNTDFIVARSSSRRVLLQAEHDAWYPQALKNPDLLIEIILIEGRPAGLIRLDRLTPEICVITAYLLEYFTGRGHGVAAITEGCRHAFARWEVNKVIACVRIDNPIGQKGFLKSGFHLEEECAALCPAEHHCYAFNRSI